MATRDRAAYMREYRARRKAADATNRTERVTLHLTAAEVRDLERWFRSGCGHDGFPEFPEHASLEDAIRHYLRGQVAFDDAIAYGAKSDDEADWTEHDALSDTCSATACRCPVHGESDGVTWRTCAATGKPRPSSRPASALRGRQSASRRGS